MSHIWQSHVTHIWVMSHTDESCHTQMSHATHRWVIARVWMIHITRMNESCHAYEWVTSRVWMSHVTRMNESCHPYDWIMSPIWMSRVTRDAVVSRIWTHSYMRLGPFICVTRLIHTRDITTRDAVRGDKSHVPRIYKIWIRVWMIHVTRVNESCHRDALGIDKSHVSRIYILNSYMNE